MPPHLKTEQTQFFLPEDDANNALASNKASYFGVNGNNNSSPFFSKPRILSKLTISQPGNNYEQEADPKGDQVAQKLYCTPPSFVHRIIATPLRRLAVCTIVSID